jgi:hypothetical protein
MPRRSTRLSLTDETAAESDAKRKRLSTGSTVKSTAKKSKYFEGSGSDDPEDSGDSGSAYEGVEVSADDSNNSNSELDATESEEEEKPKQKRHSRPASKKTQNHESDSENEEAVPKPGKGQELWREGVKTGLGPGKEVFIKKPKARDPGGIDYVDDTIHPNTMLFLADLKENNERQWLKGAFLLAVVFRH